MKKTVALSLWAGILCLAPRLTAEVLPKDSQAYLLKLAKDTYRCIDAHVSPKSGLPRDNSKADSQAHTSVTNVGFYMASVVGAMELGLESRASALSKLRKALSSVLKLETWKGFPVNWSHVSSLARSAENFISTVDLGNFYAGVIVARQTFPELREECDKLLQVNWKYLYDPRKKLLYGGYDVSKGRHAEWYYDHLGADSRLAAFLAIAMSKVPTESWGALIRTLEERYGVEYLKPGWSAGGLFLGYMSGLFIDERGTLPGLSAANFAAAQMKHQRKIGSPVWGWSASDSPESGYLGFLNLRDEVVTPHASILALNDFPKEVVQNLKKFEELGARAPFLKNGKYENFGFRDAYDLKTSRITQNYLMLDQTMIFLSLSNFLKDRVIVRAFESYPPVQEAKGLLAEYKNRDESGLFSFPMELGRKFKLKVASYDMKRPEYTVIRSSDIPLLNDQEWERTEFVTLSSEKVEAGRIENESDFGAEVSFLWDDSFLYIRANVKDQSVQIQPKVTEIYKGDLMEIYVNPDSNGLTWGSPKDFQIGVTPPFDDGGFLSYMWFQNRPPLYDEVRSLSKKAEGGYQISAAIAWKLLRMKPPVRGQSLALSVAFNDIDEGKVENTKVSWYFQPKEGKFILAKLLFR